MDLLFFQRVGGILLDFIINPVRSSITVMFKDLALAAGKLEQPEYSQMNN